MYDRLKVREHFNKHFKDKEPEGFIFGFEDYILQRFQAIPPFYKITFDFDIDLSDKRIFCNVKELTDKKPVIIDTIDIDYLPDDYTIFVIPGWMADIMTFVFDEYSKDDIYIAKSDYADVIGDLIDQAEAIHESINSMLKGNLDES